MNRVKVVENRVKFVDKRVAELKVRNQDGIDDVAVEFKKSRSMYSTCCEPPPTVVVETAR